MHFVEAKGILSAHNGMNLYRAVPMAVYTVTAGVNAMDSHMNLRILR